MKLSNRIRHLLFIPLCGVCAAMAQTSGPGTVTFVGNAVGPLVGYIDAPSLAIQQLLQTHFAAMIVYPPFFDSRLSWFPNGYAYFDLYGIQKGSWEEANHPEWILHDQNGNRVFLKYNCSGGTCPQYAADIANPAFRAAWIANTAGTTYGANYAGVFVDDVNMNFEVSDGNANQVAPIDSTTGQPMTYDAWRGYVAKFLEETRAALPNKKIMENSIWYAGPAGVQDADRAIQRQIATADIISLERGVASDNGLTGGTGTFSVYAFFNYVDRVHAAGKSVDFRELTLDAAGMQYGLASYFLISNGHDTIGDSSTLPDNWWPGYNVNLGTPLASRTYKDGVFERDFTGGKVLLAEPGLASQTINLEGTFTTLDGAPINSVTLAGRQGVVLQTSTTQQTVLVNAASQTGGAISPGEIISLPGSYTSAPVQVLINGVGAYVVSVNPTQLNVVVPFGLNLSQPSQIEIKQGQLDATTTVPVTAASPAIFTLNGTGSGQGAILNQDFSVNSSSNPAAAGSVIMVYATGLGTLSTGLGDGQIDQLPVATNAPVAATIGGVAAKVLYAGAAPGLIAGVFQVNIEVPRGSAANAAAPVTLTMGSATSQPGVTVAMR